MKKGEGGTFALYQGLYPPADYDYETDRTLTYQEHKSDLVEKLRNSPIYRKIPHKLRLPLLVWVREKNVSFKRFAHEPLPTVSVWNCVSCVKC